jgi:predicted ester cyclase
VLARDVCDHNAIAGQPRGLEGQRWFVEMIHRAVPDTVIQLEHLIAEGDFVVDHWITSGTNTGEMFGMPPTGKRFTMMGTDMLRLSNGKIVEMWHVEDNLSMMQQLGVVPASQQPPFSDTSRRATASGTNEPGRSKTLSADEKRSQIRRGYQEFIDRGNVSAADTLVAADYAGHFSGAPVINGREAFKQFISMYTNALANRHAALEDILVEGDYAACRVTLTGKHSGNLFGVPPSGKEINVKSLAIFRFAGEQVAEQWANSDDMGMLQQIGAMPVTQGMPVAEPC